MKIPSNLVSEAFSSITNVLALKAGGQKSVYSAFHADWGKVALKLIPLEQADERIQREIQTGKGKNFSHVPIIYESGNKKIGEFDFVYIIEQFVEGKDLRALRVEGYIFCFEDVMILLETMLNTLVDLEAAHIVHRDIKLDNIIRDNQGNFWLIDFGIARELDAVSLTATSEYLGPHTLGYASPEQILNQKRLIDSRADLFSLGVVIYELLTGINPFTKDASGLVEVINRTQTFVPEQLRLENDPNGEISKFLYTLMQKSPLWRPPSAKVAYDWFMQVKPRS